ncbi:MAG: D-alanyl-D-alanine carboxypeptidase/D-alanyl-D-alanine-endopeptidase [Actinobacteria bacterium]|nr:D-alanyl-D-alanine carboxypeptidase/D-alanyl-D-alanine-endopeptidase [Actinomycetota bacterium]
MSLRAQILGGTLIVGGLVGGSLAWTSEASRAEAADVATAVSAPAPRLNTPVLSARRMPSYLVAPQAMRRLVNTVGPTLGQLPATTCFEVRDADRTLVAQAPDAPFAPASNQKILTAWTALEVFGPDHTFTTTFAASAAPVGGVIDGDLWVIGGGDPVIDSAIYQRSQRWGVSQHTSIEALGDQLRAAGITAITGSVYADDSYFDNVRTVPTWPSRFLSQGQVGPLSALAVNDARTYGVVEGQPSADRPAPDPGVWAAQAFTSVLQARGVSVAGAPAGGVAPAGLTTVLEAPSLPMSELVAEMLRFSDNNTAELLLKAIGKKVGGTGSTEAGIAAMTERLGELGVDLTKVVIRDGSGLDEGNRVTCDLLQATLNDSGPDGVIADGMAVGGDSVGTLKERFRGSEATGKVKAKTGTLRWVTALSGWIEVDDGRELSFSTLVNNEGGQISSAQLGAVDRLVEQLTTYPDSTDPALVGPKPAG